MFVFLTQQILIDNFCPEKRRISGFGEIINSGGDKSTSFRIILFELRDIIAVKSVRY